MGVIIIDILNGTVISETEPTKEKKQNEDETPSDKDHPDVAIIPVVPDGHLIEQQQNEIAIIQQIQGTLLRTIV